MDIKERVKNISHNPGVYFFKDKQDQIIYIGKAKNLKKRIYSYFNKSNKNSKNKIMISKAVDIETLIVRNEVEALLTDLDFIIGVAPIEFAYNNFAKDNLV